MDRYNEEISPLYGGYSDFYGGNWPLAVLILCAKASGRIPSVLLQPYGQSSSWTLPADAAARVDLSRQRLLRALPMSVDGFRRE